MIEPQHGAVEISGEGTSLVFKTADGSKLEIPAKEEVIIGRKTPSARCFPILT
jgi:hypothetical protein